VTDTARRASTVTSSKGDTLLKTGIESVKVTCWGRLLQARTEMQSHWQ